VGRITTHHLKTLTLRSASKKRVSKGEARDSRFARGSRPGLHPSRRPAFALRAAARLLRMRVEVVVRCIRRVSCESAPAYRYAHAD
jgi:hypothetical protein